MTPKQRTRSLRRWMKTLNSWAKHFLTVTLLMSILSIVFSASGAFPFTTTPINTGDPYSQYGEVPTLLLYSLRVLTLIPLPIMLSNFFGIILGNAHRVHSRVVPSLTHGSICFRVVTRGTYPDLVKRNLRRNIELCSKVGLQDYSFEVVTDNPISVSGLLNVRELVVPMLYETGRGSLFKARALQYSIEDDVSVLNDSDWVIHLDEETLLTESSLAGSLRRWMKTLNSWAKHFLTVTLLMSILSIVFSASGAFPFTTTPINTGDPYSQYGEVPTLLLYSLRVLTLIPLPIMLSNFFGIILGNAHRVHSRVVPSLTHGSICFRVVTRGTYPDLVKRNLRRNIELCSKVGLQDYSFEVVTDNPISVSGLLNVRELVVPMLYETGRGSLFKARALQYSIEDDVSVLNDSDWVIHLDEETLLTESSLAGMLKFIHSGKYEFGQGVITYASDSVVCWITTLADLIRVGADYGNLRFTLGLLHKPVFSWKGSFIVANVKAEKNVSFDFGPEGSIAEDCFFALTAWKEGYKFGYVEGEMWEKSTFSVIDFIRQRKRWVQGISLTFLSNQIPVRYKLGIGVMVLAWVFMPVTSLNILLIPVFPIPVHPVVNSLNAFSSGVAIFLFILGAIKSFTIRKQGLFRYILLCALAAGIAPISLVLESIGVILAAMSRQGKDFHIVRKELPGTITV